MEDPRSAPHNRWVIGAFLVGDWAEPSQPDDVTSLWSTQKGAEKRVPETVMALSRAGPILEDAQFLFLKRRVG
jgi:hypothetical protein